MIDKVTRYQKTARRLEAAEKVTIAYELKKRKKIREPEKEEENLTKIHTY